MHNPFLLWMETPSNESLKLAYNLIGKSNVLECKAIEQVLLSLYMMTAAYVENDEALNSKGTQSCHLYMTGSMLNVSESCHIVKLKHIRTVCEYDEDELCSMMIRKVK